MPSGIELQLPSPKNWSDFEDICHSLWKRKWNDPEAHKHGRRGQAQQGVDVYGRIDAQGDYHGVQCKGKDGNLNSELSEKEIRHEVTEAKKFTPPLKTLVIATTAPNDAKAQKLARKISKENEKLGLFSVSVRGWEDIVSDLYDFHDVIDKHYPEHSSTIKNIEKSTEELTKTSQQTNLQLSEIKDLLSGHLDQGWDGKFDKHLNEQIDQYVELTKSGKANTALELLEKLKLSESYNKAQNRTKFRIDGNIGSAYLALGKYDEAADFLISAFAFDPEYIKARCNYAYGQLLKENREEASSLALKCLEEHEDSKEAASIFILANIKNDKIQDIENKIPASLLNEADILQALGVFYREKGNYDKQKEYTEKAFNKDPKCEKIKQTYAETLIAPIFSDMSWVYSRMMTSRYKKDAVKASRILESVYDHTKQSEGKVFVDGIAINLCSTYRFLGENQKAREIILDALKVTSENHDELHMQLVYLALNQQDPVLGLDSLNKIKKNFNQKEFFRALFYLASDQQDKAVLSFEKILKESKDNDLKVDTFLNLALAVKKTVSIDAALNVLNKRALKVFPKSPVILALAARLYDEKGDKKETEITLRKAIKAVNKNSINFEIIEVADTCRLLKKFDDAATLYAKIITEPCDHPIYEMYLLSLLNSDRRADLKKALDEIPKTLLEKPFIRKIHAIYNAQIGNLPEAEKSFRAYIEKFGCDDPDIYLHYLNTLQRQEKTKEINDFLETDFPLEKAQVREIASYYQALALSGKAEKALPVARETYIRNQSDPVAHLGYAGLFFILNTTGQALPFLNPSKIAIDTEFILSDGKGNNESFTIEEKGSLSLLNNTLDPTHELANKAIGKGVGDDIVMYENELSKEVRKVVLIRHKYVADYQTIIDKFNQRFPTHKGLYAFDADPSKDGSFEPIFKSLDKRYETATQNIQDYKEQLLTVGSVAYRAGRNILSAYEMLQATPDAGLICSKGSAEEREKAFQLVSTDSEFILDAVTIYIIHKLGIENIIARCSKNKLSTTQTTIEVFNDYKESIKDKIHGGFMAKTDSGYIWHEYRKEEIEQEIKVIDDILQWIKASFEIVSSVETKPPPDILKKLMKQTDSASYDVLLAADGRKKILLSEDLRLREYTEILYKNPCVWLQPLLMMGRDKRLITADEYAEVCAQFIQANHHYISVDSDTLLSLLKSDGYMFTDRVRRTLSYLGQKNTEMGSCYHVCGLFLLKVWRRNIPINIKQQATNHVMAALLYERWDLDILYDVVNLLQESAAKTIPHQYAAFSQAIADWLTGHFIPHDIGT